MKRRIIILGGSEFIGRRFAALLAQHAEFDSVLVDTPSKLRAVTGPVMLPCDLASEAALTKALDGADTVVNCIAGDADSMLRSARALFAVAGRLGSSVVQLSTLAAYGSATGRVFEDSLLLGDVDAYAAARAQIDRMAEQYGAVRLRPGIIYGPGSTRWSGQIGRLLCAQRLGDLGERGDGDCNLLFIDDLLNALLKVVQQPSFGVLGAVNLCGVERLTWNDYFIRYARALGAVPVRRITARRLKLETKLFAPPLKIASMARVAGSYLPELISPSMLRVFAQNIQLQTDKANHSLQLSWTNLDSGLQQSASWFRQHYHSR